MIFLEFVCESLIGSGSGQYFECPFCESSGRSLYVRTRIQKYKCYRCDAWGDEFDLMRLFYPKEKLPRHRVRLDQLRQHFKAGTSLSPLGRGHLRELEQLIKDGEEPETLTFWDLKEAGYRNLKGFVMENEFSEPVEQMVEELIAELDGITLDEEESHYEHSLALKAVQVAMRLLHQHRVHPLAVAGNVEGRVWVKSVEANHVAECCDPACDWKVCRESRPVCSNGKKHRKKKFRNRLKQR